MVKNAENIKGKVGEYLRDNLDQLALSKQLTTIKCDVEMELGPNELLKTAPDLECLSEYYTDLEFRSWLKELGMDSDGEYETQKESESNYESILTEDDVDKWIGILESAPIFAVDTETDSLDATRRILWECRFVRNPVSPPICP